MNPNVIGHLAIASAGIIWGLMAPLGKDAMNHGICGIDMVTFRVVGAMICFWLYGWLMRIREHVSWKDKLFFAGAGMFGVVTNQCGYIIGLSYTAPTNASIMTTTMPIFTLILSVLVLHEHISGRKVIGVLLGIAGALILILSNQAETECHIGDYRGDLLIIGAQCSFALYLTLFRHLIARHHSVTCLKWMMLWAVIFVCPFSLHHVAQLSFAEIPIRAWGETVFVVLLGTFVGYILMMHAQKILRPTVVAIYNYIQPIVSCLVSVTTGLAVFGLPQGIAVFLIFTGVYLVTQNRRKHRSN